MEILKQNLRPNKKRSTLRRAYGRKLDHGRNIPDLRQGTQPNCSTEIKSSNNDNNTEILLMKYNDSFYHNVEATFISNLIDRKQNEDLYSSAHTRVSPVPNTFSTSINEDKALILSEPKSSKTIQSSRKGNSRKSSFNKLITNPPLCCNMLLITFFTLFLLSSIELTNACNEAVCASIVSKCTLLKSCECEITEDGCPCCKTCFMCLDYLQTDCCSCVGLCPRPNNTAIAPPQKSKVMDFPDGGIPSLWNAIFPDDGDDANNRWTSYKYPEDKIASELTPYEKKIQLKKKKVNGVSQQQEENLSVEPNPSIVTFNCTVTFLTQCMAENKCEKSCQSMGAYQYRWFQNGCCECVGHHCKNYGINEPKCLECGDDEDDELEVDELTDEEIDQLSAQYESEIQDLS